MDVTYFDGHDGQGDPYPSKYEVALKKNTDAALAYYNSSHQCRFELVEYLYLNAVSGMMDPMPGYNHLAFIAKTVDPPHRLKLFFAEVLAVPCGKTFVHYPQSCTPVDPDTPFFTLGCGSCHPRGVVYHPLVGYHVGGSCYDSFPPYPPLDPAEKSAKELLSARYTFKSSNQDRLPDEDYDFRTIFDGYAREALIRKGFAVKLIKVVKAVRFIDFEPDCYEDAVVWVHMVFLVQDAFCDAPELFFAEFSIDCNSVGTCVRMTNADSGSKVETSCMLCSEFCPMFHPEGKYCAGIDGGTFVDALNERRSWGVRVYLEEKQPLVATQPGSYSQNGLDDVQTTDLGKENMSVDPKNREKNTSSLSTKVVRSKRQHGKQSRPIDEVKDILEKLTTELHQLRQQHGKQSRPIDEVKDILEKLTTELHQLRQNIDPLAFARQLREAIMAVEGFSHRFLNTAFKLLMKQEAEAKAFLVTDEEGKRDILIELSSQIKDM